MEYPFLDYQDFVRTFKFKFSFYNFLIFFKATSYLTPDCISYNLNSSIHSYNFTLKANDQYLTEINSFIIPTQTVVNFTVATVANVSALDNDGSKLFRKS